MAYTKPAYHDEDKQERRRLRKLPEELIDVVSSEIRAILHAHRDELRNQRRDSRSIPLDCTSGYVGEAFGIMRGLSILGYGYMGSSNLDALQEISGGFNRSYSRINVTQKEQNLKWWMSELENEMLDEEGFDGDNKCGYCMDRYGKDSSTAPIALKIRACMRPGCENEGRYDSLYCGTCDVVLNDGNGTRLSDLSRM